MNEKQTRQTRTQNKSKESYYSSYTPSLPFGPPRSLLNQGPRSKFLNWGGLKKNACGLGREGHACGFLFNFSKVTENASNDKTIDFFPHLQ